MKKYKLKNSVPGYISTLHFSITSLKKKVFIAMAINKIITVFVFLAVLCFLSCGTTEPDIIQNNLEFTLEDVSCTEAWIKLKADNISGAKVYREDSLIYTFSQNSIDTTLFDEGLLPNRAYKYNTAIQPSKNTRVVTKELTLQTMDTTSHNFTWQSWEFGQHSSSVLYDVAIINENNIWAVGEIYMKDSLGRPDPNAYNAVHWDGSSWRLKRIYFPTVCGSSSLTSYPAKAIFAFNDGQIWISSSGDKIAILKASVQINKFCLPSNVSMSINKLWGSSSSDLYAVGNGGNIAHWNGSSWQKIESGTDLQFLDIYGAVNSITGKHEILAVCTRNYPLAKAIYQIKGNTAKQISSAPIQWELFACWFIPNRHYYVVGGGIYEKKYSSDSVWKNGPLDITKYGTSGIRGNEINNIFVSGAFGEFLHYNGVSWKSYINELGKFSGSYGGIAVKENVVITVGYEGRKAKILIGKK